MRKVACVILSLCIALGAMASDRWSNIFYRDLNGILRVLSNPVDSIQEVTFGHGEYHSGYQYMDVALDNGEKRQIQLAELVSSEIGTNVPSIYIDIDGGAEVVEKEKYLNATIRINGSDDFDGIEPTYVRIKGRGNTTWTWDKKPYRLKFDKKTSLCGLKKAKSYALIANFIDNTLMRNALAFKMAQLLDMPYTNHSIPVNLYVNGTYRGAYMLTEKIGISSASVDIDESTGILFEIDTHYDEEFKFTSEYYQLPVMVKDPDFAELYETVEEAQKALNSWKANFETMEKTVYKHVNVENQIDYVSLANYLIVNCLCLNYEIGNPRSVYMYKTKKSDKYHFGPVWDFDWAFTFHGKEYPDSYHNILLDPPYKAEAIKFLLDLVVAPGFWEVLEEQWTHFYNDLAPQLFEYMDDYYHMIRVSAYQNGERWPQDTMVDGAISTETFDKNYQVLRTWLEKRLESMNKHSRHRIY